MMYFTLLDAWIFSTDVPNHACQGMPLCIKYHILRYRSERERERETLCIWPLMMGPTRWTISEEPRKNGQRVSYSIYVYINMKLMLQNAHVPGFGDEGAFDWNIMTVRSSLWVIPFHAESAVIIDLANGSRVPLIIIRTQGIYHILGKQTKPAWTSTRLINNTPNIFSSLHWEKPWSKSATCHLVS